MGTRPHPLFRVDHFRRRAVARRLRDVRKAFRSHLGGGEHIARSLHEIAVEEGEILAVACLTEDRERRELYRRTACQVARLRHRVQARIWGYAHD